MSGWSFVRLGVATVVVGLFAGLLAGALAVWADVPVVWAVFAGGVLTGLFQTLIFWKQTHKCDFRAKLWRMRGLGSR